MEQKSKTIVWNGPLGVAEKSVFSDGTNSLSDISKKSKIDISILKVVSNLLLEKKLIKNFDF